jgi:hypothetical protein
VLTPGSMGLVEVKLKKTGMVAVAGH